MKPTPGPWKVVNNGPHWNNNTIDNYEIQYGDNGECIAEHVYEASDAHLIAASPELLDICEKFEMLTVLWLPRVVSAEHQGEVETLHTLRTELQNAIAKARGESC